MARKIGGEESVDLGVRHQARKPANLPSDIKVWAACSRVILTDGPGLFSRFADVRRVADTREARDVEQTIDVPEVQPNRGTSIVTADLDHDAGSLDAVAGSEYVDDRIRLRE